MSEIIALGLDLAKNVFQAHGADASGRAVLRKKLRRDQVLAFFGQLRPCVVAMEACGGAHFWGREIGKLGHDVRLIPPAYVKPFVKRQENDAADAEAICEAAQRPAMRLVPVKSKETQGAAMIFRIRELLIRQRTQVINALRGHLGEFGQIVPQGAANAARLIAIVEEPDSGLHQIRDALSSEYAEHEIKEDGAISTMNEICRFPLFQPTLSPAEFFQKSWINKLPPNAAENSRMIVVNLLLDALDQYLNSLVDAQSSADGARPAHFVHGRWGAPDSGNETTLALALEPYEPVKWWRDHAGVAIAQ